jgi:hypothetical protein
VSDEHDSPLTARTGFVRGLSEPRLKAEGSKLKAQSSKLKAEGSRLKAEG